MAHLPASLRLSQRSTSSLLTRGAALHRQRVRAALEGLPCAREGRVGAAAVQRDAAAHDDVQGVDW